MRRKSASSRPASQLSERRVFRVRVAERPADDRFEGAEIGDT